MHIWEGAGSALTTTDTHLSIAALKKHHSKNASVPRSFIKLFLLGVNSSESSSGSTTKTFKIPRSNHSGSGFVCAREQGLVLVGAEV